jgi:hypothetical protein
MSETKTGIIVGSVVIGAAVIIGGTAAAVMYNRDDNLIPEEKFNYYERSPDVEYLEYTPEIHLECIGHEIKLKFEVDNKMELEQIDAFDRIPEITSSIASRNFTIRISEGGKTVQYKKDKEKWLESRGSVAYNIYISRSEYERITEQVGGKQHKHVSRKKRKKQII